jgi:hypothetical protein
VPSLLDVSCASQVYFAQTFRTSASEYTATDGYFTGQLLASTALSSEASKNKTEQIRAVTLFVLKSALLTSSQFSNIHLFIAAVVLRMRWRHSMCDSSIASERACEATRADTLASDEAMCLGVLFAGILEDVATARGSIDTACDLFFSASPSMAKMAKDCVWFSSLLAAVAEGIKPTMHSDSQWTENVDYDRSQRHARMGLMGSTEPQYTAAEVQALEAGLFLLDCTTGSPDSADKSLQANYATLTRVRATHANALNRIVCDAECLIRGSSPEELCTFVLNNDSKIVASYADEGCVRCETLEVPHAHHTITLVERRAKGIQNRLFLNSVVCKKLSDSPVTYLLVLMPLATHHDIHSNYQKHVITAMSMRAYRFTRVEDGVTRVEYASWLDLKGLVPQWITDQIAIPAALNAVYDQQVYFQQIRPLHESAAEDGRVVGHMLVKHADPNSQRAFVRRTAMLRECRFHHIGNMLVALLSTTPAADAQSDRKDVPSAAQDLSSLTVEHAAALGRMLASHLHHGSAVHQAVNSHPILRTIASHYDWFVPMLEVLWQHKGAEVRHSTVMKRLSSIVSSDVDMSVAPIDVTTNPLLTRLTNTFVKRSSVVPEESDAALYHDHVISDAESAADDSFTSVVMAPTLSPS